MRIYIAGKITNDPNYQRKFADAERKLLEWKTVDVINPAKIGATLPELRHEEYMKISFALIDMADTVLFLDGWEESCGASQEMGYAIATGKEIWLTKDKIEF